ncbi:hypothetical protein C8Q74DRAFT_907608 [Fomes fomentarius]|nr:hypothetical protein C8Q74DRAFT_907608 [Fomes fomentarius]
MCDAGELSYCPSLCVALVYAALVPSCIGDSHPARPRSDILHVRHSSSVATLGTCPLPRSHKEILSRTPFGAMDPFEFHPYCRIPYPVSIYPSSLLTLLFPARNLVCTRPPGAAAAAPTRPHRPM